MVKEEAAVLVVLVRRHRCAVSAAVRRAVDDEVPGAVEEEMGSAAVRRVLQGILLDGVIHQGAVVPTEGPSTKRASDSTNTNTP